MVETAAKNAPSAGQMARGAIVTVGAAKTAAVWAGSTAAKSAFRATCIRTTLKVAAPVGVKRSLAVYAGTRASNYVTGGIIPGALAALAIYDGWCIARWAYNWYSKPK
ncbi:uncharacterized protein LOC120422352 [Culex pipiens pallens]|uniref:uncharacterized protein LOC120422352 n=1 Tax=Culex pipiens pallens TaxID=42434 RepID=UPI0019537E21|nr:uncharacterized protein LOC120422352 [Culex pipiens pallens]